MFFYFQKWMKLNNFFDIQILFMQMIQKLVQFKKKCL